MAQTSEVNTRLEDDLHNLSFEVGEDLLLVAGHWDEIDAGTRGTLAMEWSNDMNILEGLDRKYRSGEMSDEQATLYLNIKSTLLRHIPVVRKMAFTFPRIEGFPENPAF